MKRTKQKKLLFIHTKCNGEKCSINNFESSLEKKEKQNQTTTAKKKWLHFEIVVQEFDHSSLVLSMTTTLTIARKKER